MMNPESLAGISKPVSAEGIANNGGTNPLMGYSIIKANSIDAVLDIAKSCHFLTIETATIEVAEIIQLP